MASQVLSGSSSNINDFSPIFQNGLSPTSQNVRLIINYMEASAGNTITMQIDNIGTITATNVKAIGKNIAFYTVRDISSGTVSITCNNMAPSDLSLDNNISVLPIEIVLDVGNSFKATCGKYNILAIPENG